MWQFFIRVEGQRRAPCQRNLTHAADALGSNRCGHQKIVQLQVQNLRAALLNRVYYGELCGATTRILNVPGIDFGRPVAPGLTSSNSAVGK